MLGLMIGSMKFWSAVPCNFAIKMPLAVE